jgi:PAS domain S-box-containing protein
MTSEPNDIQALREALEESTVAVLLVDSDLRLTFVNRVARELFDLQPDNWQGRSVLDLTPENRRELFVRLFKHVLACDHEHKLFLNLRRPNHSPTRAAVHLKPLHNADDQTTGVAAWILQADHRDALDRELLRSVEMTALRELAGAVAHHFSNLLGGMLTSIDFALVSNDSVVHRRALERIGASTGRASELIRQLQVFARAQRKDTDLADLTEVILFFCEAIEPDLSEHSIRLELDLNPVDVYAVPRQSMLEVLNRLASNAREAMPDGGTLRISLRQTDREMVLRVRDSGPGIPAELLDRIFEPFFTTKGELAGGTGRNPGLGLAVVHGLVTDMGGTVTVQSPSGEGAAFEIRLPRRKVTARPQVDPDLEGELGADLDDLLGDEPE